MVIFSVLVLTVAVFEQVFSRGSRPAGLIYAQGGIKVDFDTDNWPFFETNFLPGDTVSKKVKIINESGRLQRVGFRMNNEEGFLLSIPLFIKISDANTGEVYYGGANGIPLLISYVFPKEIFLFNLPPFPPNNQKELLVEIRFIPQAGDQFQNQQTKFDFSLGFIGRRFSGRNGFPFPFPLGGLFRR